MASVAKWLRQRIVVPPFVGSSPIVRPWNYLLVQVVDALIMAREIAPLLAPGLIRDALLHSSLHMFPKVRVINLEVIGIIKDLIECR